MSEALPSQPIQQPRPGFLFLPPYRVQGYSIAGEATCVEVPELSLCFDIGTCPRSALSCDWLALTHGHMDHTACVAYWASQRHFLGMKPGRILCHPRMADAVRGVMRAWVDLERQRTPHEVVAIEPDQEVPLKGNVVLRAFKTRHTPSSLGYLAVEQRSKLRPELVGLSQDQIVARKQAGEEVTETFEHSLVAFTGDTAWGAHLEREDVLAARILIAECTFTDPGDASRAKAGKHLHLGDIRKLLETSQAEHIVLTHLSRRQHMGLARRQVMEALGEAAEGRVHILMDSRTNKLRWEAQQVAAEVIDG